MLLILSESYDQNANNVLDWYKYNFIRINRGSAISFNFCLNSKISNSNQITLDSSIIVFDQVNAFLYSRGDFTFSIEDEILSEKKSVERILDIEWLKLKDFLHKWCESKKAFGSYNKEMFHNKVYCLTAAKQIGLQIPPTLITTQKIHLLMFVQEHRECITKAVSNMFKIEKSNFFQIIGVKLVLENYFNKLNDTFFPTLIQKKIEKVFELRIFYMKGQFYPMVIFSQNDEKTQLDYRNYNREKPNRNIPYILPVDIQEKLQLLMDKLDLDSGSIDMIVTPEGEYVFLEVNPTGQFGWVSENCNYYLEEKIANYLQGEA